MCPSEPVSPPADIGVHLSEEEVVMSMKRIVHGGPLPANVVIDFSPYNVDPWDLPDGSWFFFNSEGPKATGTGYWKVTGKCRTIYTNSSTTGSRLSLEFYIGQAPNGINSNWVMYDYRINQRLCEIGNDKDSRSLARVFFNCTQNSNHEAQKRNDAKGMSVMLNIENNQTSQNSTSRSQVKRDDEHGPLEVSNKHLEDPRSDNAIEDSREFYFSMGDYFELRDLDNSESSASSSANSRCPSVSSGEYFDSSALLRDLDSEKDQDMEKYADSKFSVSAPVRLVQVVLRPESLGSARCILSNGENHVQDSFLPFGGVNLNPSTSKQKEVMSSSTNILETEQADEATKEVASSLTGIHATSLADVESKSGMSRMQKFRKKYWCFMPF